MVRKRVPRYLGVALLIEAAGFAVGSLAHIPLKMGPIDEPKIVPATIVEALCAVALAIGGIAVLQGAAKAWELAIGAHLAVILGVLVGVVALAVGAGPRTGANDAFHVVALIALVTGFVLLWRNEDRWRNPSRINLVRTHDAKPIR